MKIRTGPLVRAIDDIPGDFGRDKIHDREELL